MGSTADKVSGMAKELVGKANQGLGKAIDNKEMQGEGLVQEGKCEAQQVKDAVKNIVDSA